jgi:hypothetical protein
MRSEGIKEPFEKDLKKDLASFIVKVLEDEEGY